MRVDASIHSKDMAATLEIVSFKPGADELSDQFLVNSNVECIQFCATMRHCLMGTCVQRKGRCNPPVARKTSA